MAKNSNFVIKAFEVYPQMDDANLEVWIVNVQTRDRAHYGKSIVLALTSIYFYSVITVRNEVAKVMFLQASVCPQGGGGWCLPQCMLGCHPLPGADTPTPEETPPPRADGHCCGRYASYWNAFLLWICFLPVKVNYWWDIRMNIYYT